MTDYHFYNQTSITFLHFNNVNGLISAFQNSTWELRVNQDALLSKYFMHLVSCNSNTIVKET